jgi:hypothetical protein
MRRMAYAVAATLLLPMFGIATPARAGDAADAPRALVTGLSPDREVDAGFVRVLDDVFLARVHGLGVFDVISSDEIAILLDLDAQRQLMGCDDDGCLAELGGVLGAQYAISGSVSRLGDELSLTLRLFDVDRVRVMRRLSEPLSSDEIVASRQMAIAAERLLALPLSGPMPPPPAAPTPWHRNPWVWGGAGGVLATGAVVGAVFLLRPGPNLGTVILDG